MVVLAPVPLSATAVGELVALLAKLKLPLTVPVTVGAKFTVNDALCPAASVNGSVGPLTLKPAPVVVACEMVTLAVDAVTWTVFVLLLPTFTLPKLSDVGWAVFVPAVAVVLA